MASLGSRDDFGVGLEWRKLWSANWELQLGFQAGLVNWSAPSSANYSLSPDSNRFFGLSAGIGYHADPALAFFLTGAYGSDVFFIRSLTLNQITVDSVYSPSLLLEMAWDLVEEKPLLFGVRPGIQAYLPVDSGDYRAYLGIVYQAILYLRMPPGPDLRSGWELDFKAADRNQATSLENQGETDIGIELKFDFSVF
jgi:hypothetical protein